MTRFFPLSCVFACAVFLACDDGADPSEGPQSVVDASSDADAAGPPPDVAVDGETPTTDAGPDGVLPLDAESDSRTVGPDRGQEPDAAPPKDGSTIDMDPSDLDARTEDAELFPDAATPDWELTPDAETLDADVAPDAAAPDADVLPDADLVEPDAVMEPDLDPISPDLGVAECGDGVISGDEVCEPAVDGPGCTADCAALCGNGLIEGDEVCDAGDENGPDGPCLADCMRPGACGDGTLQAEFEECDEGDVAPGGFCDATCRAIERVDPLGFESWPEGARVRITDVYDLRGDLVIGAGATITIEDGWRLHRANIEVRGRPGLPVLFRPAEAARCMGVLVDLDEATLIAEHAEFAHAATAIQSADGHLQLQDSVIRDGCSTNSGDVRGIWLSRRASGVLTDVQIVDLAVGGILPDGRPESDNGRAGVGRPGGSVTGLEFTVLQDVQRALVVDGLLIRGLTAGSGSNGGDGLRQIGGQGGDGGSVIGALVGTRATVRRVSIGNLRGGAGGAGGYSAGFGGTGGDVTGYLTGPTYPRPAFDYTVAGIEVRGLLSGPGGRGGQGRSGGPAEAGREGGPGGAAGVVVGIDLDPGPGARLVNAAISGLGVGSFGQGGAGGDGGVGAGGGFGGPSNLSAPQALVGLQMNERSDVEHVTIVIDDQPGVVPPPAPAGLNGDGSQRAPRAASIGIGLTGVLALSSGEALRNAIVVGDAIASPPRHETAGVVGPNQELRVEDSLIWGFDRDVFAVLARRIVQDDPLFIDRPSGDLRPRAESPAIGQGGPSDVATDLLGVERPDPPTIGAFEPAQPE